MKILDLLEGVLQVPSDVLKSMQKIAVNYALSAIQDDTDDREEFLAILRRDYPWYEYESNKGNHANKARFTVNQDNVPPSYANKLQKPFKIAIHVARRNLTEGGAAEYDSETNRILIDIQTLYYYPQAVSAPSLYLRKLVSEVAHSVEHELMHAIQHNVIGIDVGQKAAQYVGKGAKAYHNSDIELDPLIVSYVGDFLANTRVQVLRDPAALNQAILKFVNKWQFFSDLEPANRKKAMKKFHGLILNRIKNT